MKPVLLAIYVVAVWHPHDQDNTVRWHEFQLKEHFYSRAVCERYRPRLVKEWIASNDTPFTMKNFGSSRCGPWEPDPDEGEKV